MQLNSSLNKLDIPGWMKFGMNQICMEMGNQWMKRNEGPDGAATEGNRANSLTANNQVNKKPETDDHRYQEQQEQEEKMESKHIHTKQSSHQEARERCSQYNKSGEGGVNQLDQQNQLDENHVQNIIKCFENVCLFI